MAIKLGTTGNDTIIGTTGWDTIYGLVDNDVFKYQALNELTGYGNGYTSGERISDMGSGDKINLAGVDADINLSDDQAFTFIADADFSGTAGELRYVYGTIQGDVDGDGYGDFKVTLNFPGQQAIAFLPIVQEELDNNICSLKKVISNLLSIKVG
jgi:serralysin